MRTTTKIVSALAAAGVVAAAGSAFTGTGVTTTGTASQAQFVGGTVTQAVTGATLDNIQYHFVDDAKRTVDTITLEFTGAEAVGKAVTAAVTGSDQDLFTCTAVTAAAADSVSVCTVDLTGGDPDTDGGYTGVDDLAITVASSQ